MNVNQFLKKYRKVKQIVPGMTSSYTPHLVCNDGFTMSIQAGQSLYSTPRDDAKRYKAVEIGYPSEEELMIKSFAEDQDNLCSTVYGFVPIKIVDQIIEKHGGVDEESIDVNYLTEGKTKIVSEIGKLRDEKFRNKI
jgi:hypothetical protein